MAPEQYGAARTADIRSDLFALGATLYSMVTGEPPYGRKTSMADIYLKKRTQNFPPPRQLVPELSSRTDQAICLALRANPAERPASCQEFIQGLIS
jgi:serine/threonine protein kinase